MPVILGYGALTSITLSVFEFTGNSLKGTRPEIEGLDEHGRKEHIRLTRRRPVEEMVEKIGEGRGELPPTMLWFSG